MVMKEKWERKKESAKKIFGTTPFQSREGTLFDISYRKGTFLLSSYDIEQELQKRSLLFLKRTGKPVARPMFQGW